MELTKLVQQLPPETLNKMQTLMHNAMAGMDVRREMEEFERNLPPGFREKIAGLMAGVASTSSSAPMPAAEQPPIEVAAPPRDLHEARLTVLRAVANGQMSPEEAEQILFT